MEQPGLCDRCGNAAILYTCMLCGRRLCRACLSGEGRVCAECLRGKRAKDEKSLK